MSQVEVWGTREFGGVDLGDKRRTGRLVRIAIGMAENPSRAMSLSCGRSGPQAVTRLFKCRKIDMDKVLSEHKRQTTNRCAGESYIFAVQDTTVLDFTGHKAMEGLGPTGSTKGSRGLLMHTTLILNSSKTPLGIADIEVWARKEEDWGDSTEEKAAPCK